MSGDIQVRSRELLIQICEAQGIEILKGVASSNHGHMHIEYAPRLNVSSIVKSLKDRSSYMLQQESPSFKKRYLENHVWATYGAWSSGNITDKMVNEYLEHHRKKNTNDNTDFILECTSNFY